MKQITGLFAEQICEQRQKALAVRKKRDPKKTIASWIEDDRLITGQGKALVIIMNSSGCSWAHGSAGGCSMCGYSADTADTITGEELVTQVETTLPSFKDKTFHSVKLFNSGSFLDKDEIPIKAQNKIMTLLGELPSVSEVIIESRPEYVSKTAIKRVQKQLGTDKTLEVGIGLESSNDCIRQNLINKGFTLADFSKAVKNITAMDSRVKSYLLLKPPFLTEVEAIDDIVQSAIDSITIGARSVSINPVNIQNGTLVQTLWRVGLYRSPWYWSVRKALKSIYERIDSDGLQGSVDRIVCDPSGSGTKRGVHNCKKCNKSFAKSLRDYSLTQEISKLDTVFCKCLSLWKEFLELENSSRDFSLSLLEKAKNLYY